MHFIDKIQGQQQKRMEFFHSFRRRSNIFGYWNGKSLSIIHEIPKIIFTASLASVGKSHKSNKTKWCQQHFRSYRSIMANDWLIDWLIYWLIDWLIDRSIDWLIYWLIDWLIDRSIDWSIHWLIDWWESRGFSSSLFYDKNDSHKSQILIDQLTKHCRF